MNVYGYYHTKISLVIECNEKTFACEMLLVRLAFIAVVILKSPTNCSLYSHSPHRHVLAGWVIANHLYWFYTDLSISVNNYFYLNVCFYLEVCNIMFLIWYQSDPFSSAVCFRCILLSRDFCAQSVCQTRV